MSDYDIVQAMITYGGGFVSRLGQAWMFADRDNQARIKATWPEYWQRYQELAELKAAEASR